MSMTPYGLMDFTDAQLAVARRYRAAMNRAIEAGITTFERSLRYQEVDAVREELAIQVGRDRMALAVAKTVVLDTAGQGQQP